MGLLTPGNGIVASSLRQSQQLHRKLQLVPEERPAVTVLCGLMGAQDREVETFTPWVIRSKDHHGMSIAQQLTKREFPTGND